MPLPLTVELALMLAEPLPVAEEEPDTVADWHSVALAEELAQPDTDTVAEAELLALKVWLPLMLGE